MVNKPKHNSLLMIDLSIKHVNIDGEGDLNR
jgi:hypothetical protein